MNPNTPMTEEEIAEGIMEAMLDARRPAPKVKAPMCGYGYARDPGCKGCGYCPAPPTLTETVVAALRNEAGMHGDMATVVDCDAWLDTRDEAAAARLVDVLAAAAV